MIRQRKCTRCGAPVHEKDTGLCRRCTDRKDRKANHKRRGRERKERQTEASNKKRAGASADSLV